MRSPRRGDGRQAGPTQHVLVRFGSGGEWELDGDELSIGTLLHTMMACDDPPGVMEQETAIYAALESAARVEVTPGSLTVLDGEGRIALEAVEAPS